MDAEQTEHRLRQAALQAEYETGKREATESEAQSHLIIRLIRMGLGTLVVLMGIVLLPLPGPGWLVIAAGLVILSRDVAWADRVLRYLRKRVPGVPETGKIPRSSLVTMAMLAAAGLALGLWFL